MDQADFSSVQASMDFHTNTLTADFSCDVISLNFRLKNCIGVPMVY